MNKNNVAPLLNDMLQDLQVLRTRQPSDRGGSKRWKLGPAPPCSQALEQLLRQGVPAEEVLGGSRQRVM